MYSFKNVPIDLYSKAIEYRSIGVEIKGVVSIAGFIRAFYYFWVFGIISVLLDLDHVIKIYQDGMEFNIENIAYHGTRTLHIPILILSGCICLATFALLLRFLYLNPSSWRQPDRVPKSSSNTISDVPITMSNRLLLNLATESIIPSSIRKGKRNTILIECPNCNERMRIIARDDKLEFPCPFCGVSGYMELS